MLLIAYRKVMLPDYCLFFREKYLILILSNTFHLKSNVPFIVENISSFYNVVYIEKIHEAQAIA